MTATTEQTKMDVDLLIVGGGSAGLSCAIQFQNMAKKLEESRGNGLYSGPDLSQLTVAVLEKGAEIGAHTLSGAVMNPSALKDLCPNHMSEDFPLECHASEDAVYYLTEKKAFKLPVTPPPFHNEGYYVVSMSKVNRWLGAKAEALGVNIFPGFAAVDAIIEDGKVVGVRTGDKGRDKHGQPKSNFEPGMELRAKVVVFAEGTRGSLFKKVAQELGLREGKQPEVFEEGVKEIIQCKEGTITPGQVIHTAGWPLNQSIGGTFIYTLPNDRIILGLVGYLDTHDPLFDPHRELQRLKTHPFVYKMIEGGKVISYGGKTLPAGGWYSMPRLYHDGLMVCGDTASLVDVQKLKGVHLAMRSGMLAAEVAVKAFTLQDFSSQILQEYELKVREGDIGKQLHRVRNFHQTLSKGLLASLPEIAIQEITGGRGLVDPMSFEKDSSTTHELSEIWGPEGMKHPEAQIPKPDGVLFFDKLSSVYLTGTAHEEDSPNHLLLGDGNICRDVCADKYGSPCNHFCPASVYEMVPDEKEADKKRLQINFTNCIHCKTCDIKCPFENISWTAPEGGGGPQYKDL